ncbi:PREDICTED: uncharacterized protein LOC109230237 [Nicotiana attenuata]|uniref:uncharacterized protein LOC109230237 n=1 Tax=Nicotiana attenuata TaxID=49451 RepID=UPI0009056993|nr:PREDICTED: uncharacterized protein LOC109230237 [Nicotiana attenuata]
MLAAVVAVFNGAGFEDLQQLNNMLQQSHKEERCRKQEFGAIDIDRRSDNKDNIKNEMDTKCCLSFDLSEHGFGVISDDDSSIKADYFGVNQDSDLMNIVEPADGTLTSPENLGSLEYDNLFNKPSTDYDWWDFWS